MSLISRIFTYSIGLLIGVLLVYVLLFRNREDRNLGAWLPNQRVLTQIIESKIGTTPETACKLDCYSITAESFKDFLKDANVVFGKSTTTKNPCPVYLINTVIFENAAEISIELCDSVSTIKNIEIKNRKCNC